MVIACCMHDGATVLLGFDETISVVNLSDAALPGDAVKRVWIDFGRLAKPFVSFAHP